LNQKYLKTKIKEVKETHVKDYIIRDLKIVGRIENIKEAYVWIEINLSYIFRQ